ncbi:MAG: glycerol kinase GlpK [Clostridia bacterium]|nr:glycerol kinase GlpK [Clostridia bacterium]
MKKYILAIDQGTTSSRAILFDHNGRYTYSAQREVKCIFPHEGWVEEDPLELWVSVVDVVNEVLIKANATWDDIDSIGLTNQRETSIVWEKKTGKPIYNAVVWQSRQSVAICDALENKKEYLHGKTGLLINPYFSASKIRWILDNVEGAQERAEKGELLFGTVDTWLIYKMTKGKVHATDSTNASRTLLYNIFDLKWDPELCKIFNIPMSMLPEVKYSVDDYGVASFFTKEVHIYGVAGDQQASLFGHTCFKPGDSKNTYGTGCFMLMNTGDKPILSIKGLLTTIAWSSKLGIKYALEGSVFVGGSAVQWLRDGLKIVKDAPDSESVAAKCEDTDGVYLVPAFVGLGTPYWDDEVRGAAFGITRATTKYQLVRATLEGIAYQVKDVFDVMKEESNIDIKSLQVDGGATANNILMQFQSDICRIEIKKPQVVETTALGVAYLAGLKSGYFKNIEEIVATHDYQAQYKPQMDEAKAIQKCKGWAIAVSAARAFKNNK